MVLKNENYASEKLLLLEIRSGNRVAFDQLYEAHWLSVYNAAYKRLQDEDQAKDITQDIFLQIWLKREALDIQDVSSYLYVAVRNRVFRQFSRQKKFAAIESLLSSPNVNNNSADSELRKKEFLMAYQKLTDSLSDSQRKITLMRFNEGLTTDDIATHLNVSKKTVQN